MSQIDTLERDDVAPVAAETAASPVPPVPPSAPAKRSFFGGARKWRNRFIVLVMAAAAAFGSVQLIHQHSARDAYLELPSVVLSSQSIEVDSTQSGVVTAVAVHAGDHVTAGQLVGSIDVTTVNAKGKQIVKEQQLLAPSSGVVINDPMTVGSNLLPGGSFLKMYDPQDLQLVTTVPLSYLPKIGTGMSAELTAPGVPGTIKAVLKRAVPRVGNNQSDVPKGSLQLVFIAQDQSQVVKLIPGLRFHGEIDTHTGGNGRGDRAQYVENP